MNKKWSWLAVPLLIGAGCAALPDDGTEAAEQEEKGAGSVEIGSKEQSLSDNLISAKQRREVGLLEVSGHLCTGTLISPKHVITHASCINRQRSVTWPGWFYLSDELGNPRSFQVSQMWTVSTDGSDVAIGRLTSEVGPELANPAVIPAIAPELGVTVTEIGNGCFSKNAIDFPWQKKAQFPCNERDWGAPIFVGTYKDSFALSLVGVAGPSVYPFPGAQPDSVQLAELVPYRELIEEMIRWDTFGIERGVNRGGSDYEPGGRRVATAGDCTVACMTDERCRSYTFVPETSTCWLKNAIPPATSAAKVISGLPPKFYFFNLQGGDYTWPSSPSALHCRGLCEGDARCKAFTWVESTKTCWMKDVVNKTPDMTSCGINCFSGIMRNMESTTNRFGSDLPSSIQNSATDCANVCAKDQNCISFTYRDSDRRCFPKKAAAGTSTVTGHTSGLRRGVMANTDMMGSDIEPNGFVLSQPRYEECAARCARNSQCKAWTLVTRAVAGENRCFIKSAVQPTSISFGVISGVRGGEFR